MTTGKNYWSLWILLVLMVLGCSAPAAHEDCATEPPIMLPSEETPEEEPTEWEKNRLDMLWTIDDDFTGKEVEAVLVAGENWNTVSKGRARLSFRIGAVTELVPGVIVRNEIPGAYGRTTITAAGAYVQLDAAHFEDSTCVGELWAVAAHEFGHTLGITTHGESGVMRSGYPGCNVVFEQTDIDMFNAANPETE